MLKKRNGDFNFFTKDGKIDTSHPDWKSYLQERENKTGGKVNLQKALKSSGMVQPDNDPMDLLSPRQGKGTGKEKADEDIKNGFGGWSREHALTGGYNPNGVIPTTPGQLKSLTDVVRMNLEMRIRLGDLMDRKIVDSYIEKIAQGIKQFVDLGRSVSNQICHKLDRMGMEKEVEKIIGKKVSIIIEQIIKTCNSVGSGNYEIPSAKKKKTIKKKTAAKKKTITKKAPAKKVKKK
jgi:hypothetical protein